MLARVAQKLVSSLRGRWRLPLFGVALLSLLLLGQRLQVEERRVAAGKDAFRTAQGQFRDGQPAAAARSVSEFLDAYPVHEDRGQAFLLLAQCRLALADGDPTRLAMALDALRSAEREDPKVETRAKRHEVAKALLEAGAVADALDELEALAGPGADPALRLEAAETAESLIDDVDASRVAAAAVLGLVAPGPAAEVERLSALQRQMRSPMMERALAQLDAYAKEGGPNAELKVLSCRGRLFLRRHFYAEALDELGRLLVELERRLPPTWKPGDPWPSDLGEIAREAYESRGQVHLGRMPTWADADRAHLEFLLAANDLARAAELARRAGDAAAAERDAYLVAWAYHTHGDPAGATSRYQRILAGSPSPIAAYAALARLGQIFLARGDVPKGLDLLDRALAALPAGGLASALDLFDRALAALPAGGLAPAHFPDLPAPGLLLVGFPTPNDDAATLARAARLAEAFLAQAPGDVALLETDGMIRRQIGALSHAAAEAAARRGQAKERDRLAEESRQAYALAASALSRGADAAEGKAALRLRFLAGTASAAAGNPFQAVADLTAFLDACPKDDVNQPEALYTLALAEVAKGDPDRALFVFDRLAAQFPTTPRTFASKLEIARIRRAGGDLDGARRAFEAILFESDIRPESEVWKQAKFEIGHVWYEIGRQRRAADAANAREAFRSARRELEQALKYYAEEARLGILARETLAQIAIEDGEWDKARLHFEALLDLGKQTEEDGATASEEEPYKTVFRVALVREADCRFRLGQLEEAARAYQEAYNGNFDSAAALDCLHRQAVCLMRLGRTKEAGESLSRAKAKLDRLVAKGEVDDATRGRWQSLFDQGVQGLLSWSFGG